MTTKRIPKASRRVSAQIGILLASAFALEPCVSLAQTASSRNEQEPQFPYFELDGLDLRRSDFDRFVAIGQACTDQESARLRELEGLRLHVTCDAAINKLTGLFNSQKALGVNLRTYVISLGGTCISDSSGKIVCRIERRVISRTPAVGTAPATSRRILFVVTMLAPGDGRPLSVEFERHDTFE